MYCKFYKYLKLQNYTISNCIKHFLNMFIVKVAFSGRSKQRRLRFIHFPYKLPRHPTWSNKNKNTCNSSMSRVIIIWKIWHQNKKRFKHAGRSPVKFFFSFIINISGNKNSVLPQLLIKIFLKWEYDLASGQYTW